MRASEVCGGRQTTSPAQGRRWDCGFVVKILYDFGAVYVPHLEFHME